MVGPQRKSCKGPWDDPKDRSTELAQGTFQALHFQVGYFMPDYVAPDCTGKDRATVILLSTQVIPVPLMDGWPGNHDGCHR
jgi:hypothetical protein